MGDTWFGLMYEVKVIFRFIKDGMWSRWHHQTDSAEVIGKKLNIYYIYTILYRYYRGLGTKKTFVFKVLLLMPP